MEIKVNVHMDQFLGSVPLWLSTLVPKVTLAGTCPTIKTVGIAPSSDRTLEAKRHQNCVCTALNKRDISLDFGGNEPIGWRVIP